MNLDLTTISTPVDAEILEHLLRHTRYSETETVFLVDGFRHGFDLRYESPLKRQDKSENLPFGVGDAYDMWNKIMKEVKLHHYTGPFKNIPYKYFIQSPIRLVPKGENQTRLIFHLSYDFKVYKSFNFYTPDEECTVMYKDLDYAVRTCLK